MKQYRKPPHEIPQTINDGLPRYFAPISVLGPTVFSAYVFAFWSLAADIGLTHSFPLVRRTAGELVHLVGTGASINVGCIYAPLE